MKKWWRFLVSVIVFLMFLVNLVNATDIYDCNQLQSMSLGDAHRLMNDINCNEINFVSILDNINKFTGSLNGRGYKIYGLHIDESSSDYVGLISSLAAGAKIENLVLVVNMTFGNNYVGTLAGRTEGMIWNCKAFMGSMYNGVRGVKGNTFVGGLVGYNFGNVLNSTADINVDGIGNYVGGLIGFLGTSVGSYAINSNAKGNINGNFAVGGLVGYVVASGIIENSYATGSVSGTSSIGGLLGDKTIIGGDDSGVIRNSYSTGNVISTGINAGGLVGNIHTSNPANIVNCFATGSVSGTSGLGGLIGHSNTACSSSYKTTNSYYPDTNPIDNCGISQSGSPVAFYSKTHDVYDTNMPNWDFDYIWNIDDGAGLPYLKSEKYCGDGFCRSDENCYCASDCACTGGNECQGAGFCLPPPVPLLSFVFPTKSNNDLTGDRFYKFNVSIYNPFLKNFKLNWNGTNFTLYNESLILMMNFDNVALLGESFSIIKDLSKYGNNGSVSGAIWTNLGKFNGAYSFDGTSNNYVNIPSFGNLQGDYTVSAWIKRNDASNCIILSKGGDIVGERDYQKNIEFRIQDNKMKFWFGNTGATGFAVDIFSNTLQAANTWYFLTVTKSGNNLKIYLNGNLDGIATANSLPYQTTSLLKIANYKWDGGWYAGCNGIIDELRIWDRSLTSAEINESYMGSLNKFNSTQWYLYVNQSKNPEIDLDIVKYFYQAFSSNSIDDEGKTELRNITIIPSGVNQVFWGNLPGTAINSADKKDRVKLIARGSALTGNLEYEVYKSIPLWFDKKTASQNSDLGFITLVMNESGSYWFRARREGDIIWTSTTDNEDSNFRYLAVSGTENNFVLNTNITSPQTGDIYLTSELIEFSQSTYDEDDFFDFIWELGDGITKFGNSENYQNYIFAFNSYASSGQKNINLGAVDERGIGNSDEKSIFVINLDVIANYTFAYITKPEWGESVNGPFVKFNATKSFAIEVNSSKNITCLGGDCPLATTGGTLIYNSYNLRGNYDNINFSWIFDDGDRYYVRGINGTNFTKIFGVLGQHNAELTVIIPNANSLTDTNFDINFINYCEADGLKYWNESGNSFNTLASPVGCGGLNKIPGGNDDCCPANYGCTATGCKLNLTIQQLCNNISFCSDYKDSVNCSLDLCRVGSDSACGGIVQTSADCRDDFFIKTNCSCKYNAGSGKCELNSQIRGSIFQSGNELIYYCNTTTNHGECNTQNGFMRVQMNSTLTGVSGNCDLNESLCSTEQGSVVCGAARIRLPFFTFFNFILSVILIVFIYTIIAVKRKKTNIS